jgi:hypothetical protein
VCMMLRGFVYGRRGKFYGKFIHVVVRGRKRKFIARVIIFLKRLDSKKKSSEMTKCAREREK